MLGRQALLLQTLEPGFIHALRQSMPEASVPASKPAKVPAPWQKWCTTGKHGCGARKKKALLKCLQSGHVRGYFSGLVLRPDLPHTDSMYPSLEHLTAPNNHSEAVVEARIFNDMKSHLSEAEFWKVIEHFFIVGVEKKKIIPPFGKKLSKEWSPARHYVKAVTSEETCPPPQPTSK
jgi:hypothetical protein